MAGRAMIAGWGGSAGSSGASGLMSILKNNGRGSVANNGGTVPAPKQVAPKSLNGGSVPAPAQRAPSGPVYTPPPQDMVYTDPRITNPNDNWAQPLARQAAPADMGPIEPAVPQGPVAGGRQWYEALGPTAKAATENDWLGGDSDYTAQLGEYERALDDFLARIKGQKDNFELDRKNAVGANELNETNATNSLGEDFGARGMSYSGLFDKSKNDLRTRFTDQEKNINLVAQRNNNDADNRRKDYEAENTIGRGNAKRSALARMAAQQSMIDSNAGMF